MFVAAFAIALLWATSAQAAIPASLKSACATQTPHTGYSYKFCDDGLPPSGGTTPNAAGTNAVEVPAKYEGFVGLPEKASDATNVPGSDPDGNIALDVDISVPTVAAPPGGYPMLVFMHGCCSGNKTSWEGTSFDTAGERWHYNNAWFASRGYVVVTYTSRGFHNGENNGSRGSTGETQLDSRNYEINDFQHLAGQIADDPFFDVDPQKVVVTGGSYGGGFSWMAFTDPIWQSPAAVDMKLAAAAPKYGWTDLVYSLVPTGKHNQLPGFLPAFDGSDSTVPIGIPKKSIVAALYDSGKTGIPPGSPHATFSSAIDQAFGCLQSTDPYETNPLCTTTIADTLPEFINDRSAYYQNNFFALVAADPAYRTPVFNAATFTDPLFPPSENRRMANRLRATVPDYPIQQYFGDYQHFVQNKAKEWGDLCGANHHVCSFGDYPGGNLNADPAGLARTGATTRLNRFIDHYAQPPGNASQPAPQFDVTASLQICPQNAGSQPADEPGDTYTAGSFEALTTGTLQLDMHGNQITTNDASPNTHAANAEPVANSVVNGGRCPVESSSSTAGPGVAVYTSDPLTQSWTMLGATTVSIDYSATTAQGLQLNARLYDVFPDGSSVMVDRGVRRVESASGKLSYQLHGNGWRFPAGHRVRIEIAQDDDPYLRASTIPSTATISHVTLRIPVREDTPFARPKGASPLRVPLVVAYQPCTAPNREHGPPLAFGSCNPPQQSSGQLTVGTQDANGKPPNLVGSIRYGVQPGDPSTAADEADVTIDIKINDVRRRTGLADYTGEVLVNHTLRITDRYNGPAQNEPGTMVEYDFPIFPPCHVTTDPDQGADCSLTTTADTIVPGAIKEGKRTIWQMGKVDVFDGGVDGDPRTFPNNVFLTQGVFVP
jgi:dienelactone hydrolase